MASNSNVTGVYMQHALFHQLKTIMPQQTAQTEATLSAAVTAAEPHSYLNGRWEKVVKKQLLYLLQCWHSPTAHSLQPDLLWTTHPCKHTHTHTHRREERGSMLGCVCKQQAEQTTHLHSYNITFTCACTQTSAAACEQSECNSWIKIKHRSRTSL